MRASRSQPAQEIAAENVWRCSLPRNSHGPASGSSKVATARLPSRYSRSSRVWSPRAHQALVEEQLRRREDHRAVHVVLHLLGGEIAEAHRAHAAITGQRRGDLLLGARIAGDAVQRLQRVGGRRGDDVIDVMQIGLHGARGAEAVERLHHEVAVAQPAIAIVPVARAVARASGMEVVSAASTAPVSS